MLLPDHFLDVLLGEDVPHGDLTTHSLGIGESNGSMQFAARSALVACCVEEAVRIVERAGGSATALCRSGDALSPGAPLLDARGPAGALFAAWKVAQTLVEAASGIATATRAMVDAAAKAGGAVVACTRKTFPGGRAISLKGVLAGGGVAHRLGLSDSILVFPEHRGFLDGDLAVRIARVKAGCPERKVVAEVTTLDDALAVALAGVDALQLEKFTPKAVAAVSQALASMSKPPLLAAAGGINEGNAEAYTRAGAQVLVTSWPYSAKPAEVQVTIRRA
jgi:molybdenum transport protein